MTDVSAWLDFMPAQITRRAFTKRNANGYGGPAYSTTTTTYAARVVAGATMVTRPDGQEVVATHTMWVGSTQEWREEDQLTFGGSTFAILDITRYPDENGAHHVRLKCRG
jgi:hypothetical protein